jgi:uncharacterized repeat protein (TIGR01451 family)
MRYSLPLLTMFAVAMFVAAAGVAAPGTTGSADLKVTKADGPDPVSLGSALTYTIQVENLGPDAATGVVVTDSLPKEVDFVSATSTQGKCTAKGRKVACELGTMPAPTISYGAPPTVTVVVIPRKVGTISNTASVDGVEKDPVGKNSRATATTTVVGPAATCRGVPASIVGTGGNDALVGTIGRDVIAAFGGDDSIASLSGRDLVCAGRGSDRVGAGSAADRVFGGPGNDRLLGRGGPDVLRGGAGGDLLKGQRGNDRLRGGSGKDRCLGGAGADSIRGCERL